jgi:hypothetical protein
MKGVVPHHDARPHWEPGLASSIFCIRISDPFTTNTEAVPMANKEQNRKGKTNKPKLTAKEKQAKKLAANRNK